MFRSDLDGRLFEYLRQIIYEPERAGLDRTGLKSEELKLADGLDVLRGFVLENSRFGYDLTHGFISQARIPSRENVLAGPLKAIHSMLSHLLWLMDEVADGDYRQRLDLANDLSRSFNAMVGYLVELSLQDKLTGLLNEDGFIEKATGILRSSTSKEQYFIVCANVNEFKNYNALYGSEKGDCLLRKVGVFLHGLCRPDEICARVYADNFMGLVRGESAEAVVRRMDVTDVHPLLGINGRRHLMNCGIYPVRNRQGSVREMCECAVFAGNSLKDTTQRYAVFDEKLSHQYTMEKSLLENFELGIKKQLFQVYYQPKVDAKSGRILAGEALVRWNSPYGEVMLPGNFIQLFEKKGLITILDFYVLDRVCQYLQSRQERGLELLPIAVNFSRVHMLDQKFVQNMKDILDTYGIEPRWIEVEVTETVFFERMEVMKELIGDLHEAGFTVAMDDFGAGFSSLNFLRNIPVDVIKIDKLFFESFDTDERVRFLVEDILSIASHLRLQTVAEGIEKKSQVDFLRENGCDLIQGYYFYKPLMENEFDKIVQADIEFR